MSIPVMIIPVLNRFDLLEKSLASIDYPIDEILIINNSGDDSNTDGLKEKFDDLNLRVLNLPSNMGISGSWNLGIKLYPFSTYWLISSADTSFLPGSLKKMDQLSGGEYLVKSDADYSCFSLGEKIVATVGLFDEYIYPAYFEDNDYDDRVVLAGLESSIIRPGIAVDDSGGSQTIKSNSKYLERNHETFVSNSVYYAKKKASGDYTVRGWNLTRRRFNEWSS
jgi:GT2 family glycosyltransferase